MPFLCLFPTFADSCFALASLWIMQQRGRKLFPDIQSSQDLPKQYLPPAPKPRSAIEQSLQYLTISD
jgi:hypothetical protein